jgi:hypothetical protein
MALEYRLVIVGEVPLDSILNRAFRSAANRPAVEVAGDVWIAKDVFTRLGFDLRWRHGTRGYFEAHPDGSVWIWEPPKYTGVAFRLDKFFDWETAVANMRRIVSNLLASGPEDMALIFNGDQLLVLRERGQVKRFGPAREWAEDAPDDV